ncbi:MAG: outer membrane protein transport protein, partial [Pseudomonadota bacterium]
ASHVIDMGSGLSLGLQLDQPFGAAVSYNGNPAADMLAGTAADITTMSLNAIAKYQFTDRVSVFGGLRLQSAAGEVSLNGLGYAGSFAATATSISPALAPLITGAALENNAGVGPTSGTPGAASTALITALGGGAAGITSAATAVGTAQGIASGGGYKVDISDSWGVGYTLGAAYEIPSIAFRAAVTYNSAIEHKGDTTETVGGGPFGAPGQTTFETPSSVNIDFQTGIAEGTLLTASARFAEWGSFDVVPPNLGSDLADIGDSQRYTLGVGRALNDQWAVSATLSHEPKGNNSNVSPLAPSNGLTGLTLGARYQNDGMTVSGGVNYTKVGDANAAIGGSGVATFTGNSVIGVGMQVKFEF